jgi:D-inositol-3-phosphate glycosyltransferase
VDDGRLQGRLSFIRPRAGRRIAILSLHTSPTAFLGQRQAGGMNVYVHELCSAFSDRGVATDVFTRCQRPDDPVVESLAPLSRVIYVPAGSPELDRYGLLQGTTGFARRIARHLQVEGLDYDLIYSHYWLSGVAAGRLRAELDAPWAHTAHTLGLVKNRQLARGARPEPLKRIAAEREIARAADLLVVSTEAELEDMVECYGADRNRISVVAPGVDLATFRPQERAAALHQIGRSGQRLLLFVGRLERLKGVEIILRAIPLLGASGDGVRLLILGEDSQDAAESEKQRLRQVAFDLGIADRVHFAGPVAHNQLPAYYAAAELCLMPSYSESFGLVGLEAQACGCPVVASNVAGLASLVRHGVTGYLVSGDNPADYAVRIRGLLDDPELGMQMGRRGTLLAQRFSWGKMADRLLTDFDVLARRHQLRVQLSARLE